MSDLNEKTYTEEPLSTLSAFGGCCDRTSPLVERGGAEEHQEGPVK